MIWGSVMYITNIVLNYRPTQFHVSNEVILKLLLLRRIPTCCIKSTQSQSWGTSNLPEISLFRGVICWDSACHTVQENPGF